MDPSFEIGDLCCSQGGLRLFTSGSYFVRSVNISRFSRICSFEYYPVQWAKIQMLFPVSPVLSETVLGSVPLFLFLSHPLSLVPEFIQYTIKD